MNLLLKNSGLLSILLLSITAQAAPVVFTDSATFNSAISGYTKSLLDFESSIAGDLIADGGSLGGITLNYPTLASFGVSIQIRDDFSANSGTKYVGTDDGGAFLSGDAFTLSFASANAVGMFFLSGDALLAGDISLTIGATVASLPSTYETTLSDGSYVYFLGFLDDINTFSGAEVASIPGGFFEFNVDDITTAKISSGQVPEPAILWLLSLGLILLLRQVKQPV